MSTLRYCGPAFLALASWLAYGQDVPGPSVTRVQTNLEIRVSGLPSLRAQSGDAPDVVATAVATVLNDKDLCCDRRSALEDRLPQSDPTSLREVAAKLQGRQLRTDGRPVLITAELFTPAAITASQLLAAIRAKRAALMVWNSRLYVVSGVVYDDSTYSDGADTYVIHKLLLLDTRYSDARREVSFNRDTEDLSKVEGLLFLTVTPQ